MRSRRIAALAALALATAAALVLGITRAAAPAHHPTTVSPAPLWPEQAAKGETALSGQVPLAVGRSSSRYVGRHPARAMISLNFGLPLHDKAALNALIDREAKTHRYLTRGRLYARFSPPVAQYAALRGWLGENGFTITHVGADRLAITAKATTTQVERALHVKIDDYVRAGYQYGKVDVKPYVFFANTTAPKVPARLGLQTIPGLTSVDRFYTSLQLAGFKTGTGTKPADCSDDDQATINPLCVEVRSGGYFPGDLRSLYDITGHGYDATGQTIGFTLWTTPERQAAMTAFAAATGDTPITVDMPSCTATGNSPTTPSSCSTVHVSPDHLLSILENGNTDSNSNFGSNVETALDIEAAHGVATHAALKYYASECASTTAPGSGLTNAGCNGTDVGLEEAVEDAASDTTLHSVSNSWGYGGDAEWGNADPFVIAIQNSLAIGAAAGTTFYFSTGDSGTYESGFPADSQYVVAVGGTSTYSTSNPAMWSTSTEWSGSGSWCSNIIARPAWQAGAGVTANAPCPGRVAPDVSAVADPNTGVKFYSSTNLTGGTQNGQVGGTSLSAPVMNGLEADTESFVAAQSYPGPAPKLGFVAPVLYQLGNGGHATSYYRDIVCGNTANPTSGPDGDAAGLGWDAASGWGEPDWFNFATGYALALGATNLSVPPSLSQGFSWACSKTPSNSTERGIACPSSSTCYAGGSASGNTPWPGKFLPSGAWGAVNTFFKSTDGGATFFPSNSDMLSINCTSSATCMEVGVGGRERRTTDGGNTWGDVTTGFDKPLTRITCPSSSVCYAAGDRGTMLKSTDGGQTWSYLSSTDGNPIYGLSCPSPSVCYATDIYAHVIKTTDGGASFTWQSTPITTPGVNVAASGGPNPYAGLLSISCSSTTTCVATALYVVPTGQVLPSADPPIITTTDGGTTWVRQTSNAGGTQSATTTLSAAALVAATNINVASAGSFVVGQQIVIDPNTANSEKVTVTVVGTSGATGTGVTFTPALALAHASGATVSLLQPNYLHDVTCPGGTTTCFAVGRNGAIVTTTNLTTWTPMTSGTTNLLDSVYCSSTSFCIAVGLGGTVDRYNGSTWTASPGAAGTGTLAGVTCDGGNLVCYATGKQGATFLTTTGGASWTQQAGGGTTNQVNSIACPSTSICYAAGNTGTILKTSDGGQTWLPQTAPFSNNLTSIACNSTTACAAVAATAFAYTTNGSTWALAPAVPVTGNAVACAASTTTCIAVGAGGAIVLSTNGGQSYASVASATSNALNAVSCPSTTCYAAGASGTIVKTTDGTTWTTQTSNTTQALNGISCLDASNCFAGGAVGTVVATTDGSTWAQQGNPLSGPTTAINATSITINGAGCNWTRCMMGTAAQGDIMDSPLVTVTVTASGPYGTTPALTGLSPSSAFISYSPSSEAPHIAGTLACTTTATNASPVGAYPITSCSGLSDPGFNVVYNYGASSYTIAKAAQTIAFAALSDRTWGDADFPVTATASSGLPVSFTATGPCTVTTNGSAVHLTGVGVCSIKASQAGSSNYLPAPDVTQSFTIHQATSTLSTTASPPVTLGGTIKDTATLGGGYQETGTITFKLYGPSDANCTQAAINTSTATVNGNGNYDSAGVTPLLPGNYHWIASYSGDANNTAVAGVCNSANESTVVGTTKASPSISTHASANVAFGGSVSDTSTLSGGTSPTGTITFSLYNMNDPNCTAAPIKTFTVTVSGNGNYSSGTFTPANTGTYRWIATYSGDGNNNAFAASCNAPNESVTVGGLLLGG